MARVPISVPSQDKDYDSKKSIGRLVNCFVETNKDGSFRSIKKREGVLTFADTSFGGGDGIISNFTVADNGTIYLAGETNGYTINSLGSLNNLGDHNLGTRAGLRPDGGNFIGILASPSDAVFFSLFGRSFTGVPTSTVNGSVWNSVTNPSAWTDVVDVGYYERTVTFITYLANRFWFSDVGSNGLSGQPEFFASDQTPPESFDPLVASSVVEQTGSLRAVVSKKSAIHIFTTQHIEYWQYSGASPLPVRLVQGATHNIGILTASGSASTQPIDTLYEWTGFVGSDFKVYLLTGNDIQIIGDLSFMSRVDNHDDASVIPYVYFVDGSDHKYFCVTSVALTSVNNPIAPEEFTWCYDLKTGQSHYRTSPSIGYWDYYFSVFAPHARDSTLWSPSVREHTYLRGMPAKGITEPTADDTVYTMSSSYYNDDGTDFEVLLQTESLSFDKDVTISSIEIEMETGVGNADSTDPVMTVEYSKNGGSTWNTWGTVELGDSANQDNRVKMNSFGRLVRHRDFVLRLTMSEPVRFELYGIYAMTKD